MNFDTEVQIKARAFFSGDLASAAISVSEERAELRHLEICGLLRELISAMKTAPALKGKKL